MMVLDLSCKVKSEFALSKTYVMVKKCNNKGLKMSPIKSLIHNLNATEKTHLDTLFKMVFSEKNLSTEQALLYPYELHELVGITTEPQQKALILSQYRIIAILNSPISLLFFCFYSCLPFESIKIIANIANSIIPCIYLVLYDLLFFSLVKVTLRLTRLSITLFSKAFYLASMAIGLIAHTSYALFLMVYCGLASIGNLLIGRFVDAREHLLALVALPYLWLKQIAADIVSIFKCDQYFSPSFNALKNLNFFQHESAPDTEYEDVLQLIFKIALDLIQPVLTVFTIFADQLEKTVFRIERSTLDATTRADLLKDGNQTPVAVPVAAEQAYASLNDQHVKKPAMQTPSAPPMCAFGQ